MTEQPKGFAHEAATPDLAAPDTTPEAEYQTALDALEPRQRLFVEAYLREPNATKAAKTAGYSKTTARQMGSENLSKPAIKRAIESGFRLSVMGPQEVLGLITDVARGTTEDLFTFEVVEHRPRVQRYVRDLLAELQAQIAFETEFASRASLSKKELTAHKAAQRVLELQALRMELELTRTPNVKRWVYGDSVQRREAHLDLDKMRAAGKLHLVKEVKWTRFGPAVKVYDGMEARVHIGKAHGVLKENVEHSGEMGVIGIEVVPPHEADETQT
ncbi:terminase small subunit [Deinococcus oregonensis]|uniref:Terminase small subunit n=1 Tax=Deinococcus oregonensis TaxID=1805970 RepID=A0ABV6AXA8_9DEIO